MSGRRFPVRSLAAGIAIAIAPLSGQATPGFAAGFAAGCGVCAGAAGGAFGVIQSALTLSEQAIGRAINEGIYTTPIPVGFPMLQAQIQTSVGKSSSLIVGQIERTTKNLVASMVGSASANVGVEQTVNTKKATNATADAHGGCQSLAYGTVSSLEPRSSLGWGYQYVTTGQFVSDSGELIGDAISPPDSVPTDADGIQAQMMGTAARAAQVANQDFLQLRQLAAQNGNPDATIPEILNPSVLISDEKLTLSIQPDEYGLSDDQRADYLIQYLMVDAPTHGDALAKAATTPAELRQATQAQLDDMEFGMAMKALDDHIRFRRARSQATDVDQFLAEAMGEPVPEVTSNENFWYNLAHYRQRDAIWLSQVAVDDAYALAQQVQMEAEHLAMKFEKWKTKRTKVLLLAQVAANMMEKERDGF